MAVPMAVQGDPPILVLASAHAETEVLTADECRKALKLSCAQWYRKAPTLPVSYALGEASPRYIWGDILEHLRRTRLT